MKKIEQLRQRLEQINAAHGEKYHLVHMGGNNYGLYNGNYAFNVGKFEAKGSLDYLNGFLDGKQL